MLHATWANWFRRFGIVVGTLLALGIGAVALTRWLPWEAAIRAAIALPFLLIVPGYAMTWIVFPDHVGVQEPQHVRNDHQALDVIERVTLGVILSILVTSLVVYALSPASKIPRMSGRLTPRALTVALAGVNIFLVGVASVRVRMRSMRRDHTAP
ncbi:DUF1616 domain-containing protein [Candidatus Uhrbacteria bacterium]|nr:DUF1616 domain-containing protein [Candidatus Uhrbacteria bacterium]